LEDVDTEVDIYRASEMIRENIKISTKEILGYFESKKHKPWSNKGCSPADISGIKRGII
jgi:hypothetical protein